MMESSFLVVAAVTIPSILLLFGRFGEILWRQFRPLLYNLRQVVQPDKTPNYYGSVLAFAVHVVLGLPLLLAVPHLAFLCLPPMLRGRTAELPKIYFIALAVALIAVNASVFFILPHPDRFKSYKVTKRVFVNKLSLLYVSALQYVAMAATPVAFLVEHSHVRVLYVFLSMVIYAWSTVIGYLEWFHPSFPWEDQLWSRPFIESLGYGTKTKSKLTEASVHTEEPNTVALASCVVTGALSTLGCLSMLRLFLLDSDSKAPPKDQSDFFVITSLYMVIVMSSGFFTSVQTQFEGERTETGSIKLSPALKRRFVVETMLTQCLPMLTLAVGPAWLGTSSFLEFQYQFFFWPGIPLEDQR